MNVLPGDMKLATELYECCYSCLERARMELKRDNLEEADRWVDEFKHCKSDLDKLVRRKKEHDRLVQIVRDMQKKGVDLTIVERRSYK
jgi:hypothetical protein